MIRRFCICLPLVLLVFIICTSETPAIEPEENLSTYEFSKQFWEAFSGGAGDEELRKLIRRAEFAVFDVAMRYSQKGLELVAGGDAKNGGLYLYVAGVMAGYYAEEFGKSGLSELVVKYSQYDQGKSARRLEADELRTQGFAAYETNNVEAAVEKWKGALRLYRDIDDDAGISIVMNALAHVLYSQGRYKESVEYSLRSLSLSEALGNSREEASSLKNIAICQYNLGRYAPALEHYEKALNIYKRSGTGKWEGELLLNMGNTYLALGQVEKAISNYRQCAKIFKLSGQREDEASCLMNFGTASSEINMPDALNAYSSSLAVFRELGNKEGEASVLLNMGVIYISLGDYERGLENFQSSLQVFRTIGDVRNELMALVNISLIEKEKGNYAESLRISNEAIIVANQIGYSEELWRLYVIIAEALRKSGRAEEAVEHYRKAIDVIEEIYASTKGLKEEERSSMLGKKSFVYQEFIELLLELHKMYPDAGHDREAFTVSEKAKSRVFQEMMAKAGARVTFSGDEVFDEMVDKERQLIAKATALHQRLTEEMSRPERERKTEVTDSLKEELSAAERALTEHEREMEKKYPRYADLKRPRALTVEELQGILKRDETVIAYSVGEAGTAAFVIAKDSFELVELEAGREELGKLVKRFREGLDGVAELSDLRKFSPRYAHELYLKLFQPLEKSLEGATKLYVSADDVLYTVPLEALVSEFDEVAFEDAKGGGPLLGEYGTLRYLLEDYTITYLPSASVLRSLRMYAKPGYGSWDTPLVAFADPVFGEEAGGDDTGEVNRRGMTLETEISLELLSRSTGAGRLQRLKETAEEALAIRKAVGGSKDKIYLRWEATEDNVYGADLQTARYVLFSTHGLLGGEFEGVAEPSLALTLVGNPPGRDGFLSMSEVLGLDMNAELVILSACNTYGRGEKAGSGEGFAGLTRSFMYAGGRSLLITHWSVENQAAMDLMVDMFKEAGRKPKPDALRESKLRMKGSSREMRGGRLSLSHPFFWAPFVIVGEAE